VSFIRPELGNSIFYFIGKIANTGVAGHFSVLPFFLFSSLVLSQDFQIIGGEYSVWDIGFGGIFNDLYELAIGGARLYDPTFAKFTGNPFFVVFGTYFSEDYYSYYYNPNNFDNQPDPSGSFIGTTYHFTNLNISKQFYVSPTLPVVRTIVTLTAISTPIAGNMEIFSILVNDGANIVDTYNGDLNLDASDLWYVTGPSLSIINGTTQAPVVPFVTWSVSGPGSPSVPLGYISTDGSGDFYSYYHLDLQPGESQSLLFFAELSNTADAAITAGAKYVNIAELQKTDLLFGLSDDDLNIIANWQLQQPRKVSSYTGICDFANEIKDRVSKLRPNERHSFTQPWRC